MSKDKVTFHPALINALAAHSGLSSESIKESLKYETVMAVLKIVVGENTFQRVRLIIEREDFWKRAAYYSTISDAARAGYDFSNVETLRDIADIYAHYFVYKNL
ncbi:MAG: hypothetical protein AB7C97_05655 [Oscillospiraceae bacterium]